jgi:HSP20 family molecular chaperone IbpA
MPLLDIYLSDALADLFGPSSAAEQDYKVFRSNGGAEIECDLPGRTREDVELSVQAGVLHIRAKAKPDARRPRKEEKFRFSLGDAHDTGSISASMKNGVLYVRIPVKQVTTSAPISIPVS